LRLTRLCVRWGIVPVLLSVAALAAFGADVKDSSGEIVVGQYGSLSGPMSTFGSSTLNGINLAVKEINAAGGINGRRLKIVSYDDHGRADGALGVAQKLVKDRPVAVIGEVASTLSISAGVALNQAHIPMISPSSTNPRVTQIGPYIFRVCFIDPFQGYVAARFATETLHTKRAAILTEETSDYSHGLSGMFAQNFPRMGGKIVDTETYVSTDVDFKSALTKIKAANPDIVYIPGYYSNIGPIAKQAREIGLNVPLLGGDGWDSPALLKGAGGALEGAYFTNHWYDDDPAARPQRFITDYQRRYGKKPDALAALGYDAVGVLADAMKRVGAPDDGDYASAAFRAKLRGALAGTEDYKGVTGDITIDSDRNAIKSAVVMQIKDDKETFAARVLPPSP
jgi:branched-chain amino acid transport system substrate-binding protein